MKNKKTSDGDKDKTSEQPGAMKSNCAVINNSSTVPVRLRHCN